MPYFHRGKITVVHKKDSKEKLRIDVLKKIIDEKIELSVDFKERIELINEQINEAKNKIVKTEEEANKEPDRPDPKTVERD